MTLLNFPDVNVWLALLLGDHGDRQVAVDWWDGEAGSIAFTRFTQVSVLRLLTTGAAMNDRPLTMSGAWRAYDRLFEDDRVLLILEPTGLEEPFRAHAGGGLVSPKVWADAYLLAFAEAMNGRLITLDRGLAARSGVCVGLGKD